MLQFNSVHLKLKEHAIAIWVYTLDWFFNLKTLYSLTLLVRPVINGVTLSMQVLLTYLMLLHVWKKLVFLMTSGTA